MPTGATINKPGFSQGRNLFDNDDWKADSNLFDYLQKAVSRIPIDCWVGISDDEWKLAIITILEHLNRKGYCLVNRGYSTLDSEEARNRSLYLSPLKTDGSVDFGLTLALIEVFIAVGMDVSHFEGQTLSTIAHSLTSISVALRNAEKALVRKENYEELGLSHFG